MVSVSIDSEAVQKKLKKIVDKFTPEVQDNFEKVNIKAVYYARRYHRYKKRTGNLARATDSKQEGMVNTLYINDSMAPYGEYVHDGQRSWAPDKFLLKAFLKYKKEYIKAVHDAFKKVSR